jgi:plasmid stability protein
MQYQDAKDEAESAADNLRTQLNVEQQAHTLTQQREEGAAAQLAALQQQIADVQGAAAHAHSMHAEHALALRQRLDASEMQRCACSITRDRDLRLSCSVDHVAFRRGQAISRSNLIVHTCTEPVLIVHICTEPPVACKSTGARKV